MAVSSSFNEPSVLPHSKPFGALPPANAPTSHPLSACYLPDKAHNGPVLGDLRLHLWLELAGGAWVRKSRFFTMLPKVRIGARFERSLGGAERSGLLHRAAAHLKLARVNLANGKCTYSKRYTKQGCKRRDMRWELVLGLSVPLAGPKAAAFFTESYPSQTGSGRPKRLRVYRQ